MNVHKNARLTPHSRAELVRRVLEDGQAPKAVATAFGLSTKTIGKWVERFKAEGLQRSTPASGKREEIEQCPLSQ